MKNSILLYANRYKIEVENGETFKYEDSSVSVNALRFAAMLKLSWNSIMISDKFYLRPFYVLGYELTNEFKERSQKTRFLDHEFGVVFFNFSDLGKRKR